MISFTLSILSLIALSVAQNQTVSLFLPYVDYQSLVGSIVGGDATATTYVVECANGGSNALAATTAAAATTDVAAAATSLGDDDSDDCGFTVPITIVEGPSTVIYTLPIDDSTETVNCDLQGSTVAVCTAVATGPILTEESIPATTAATLSGTDVSYAPVVITAGSVSSTASTPTSASTTGGAKGGSTTPTSSGNSNGGTQTQSGSTTSPSAQASGAAMHMRPAMGMGAAGALAAVAAIVL